MGTVVDKPAQELDAIIHGVIFGIVVDAADTLACADLPFLALPVIHPLFRLGLSWLGGFVYRAMATAGTFAVLDLQTDQERSAYDHAVSELSNAQVDGDPKEIAAATDEFRKRLQALVHFDGSAPV